MLDSFFLRFNLEKSGNPNCDNSVGAIAKLFDQDESFLAECAKYYEKIVSEKAKTIYNSIAKEIKDRLSKKSIIFFGDSITSDRLSYAHIIEKTGLFKLVKNCAVSGTISSQMVRDMRDYNIERFDYISLFIGTNDTYIKNDFLFTSYKEYKRSLDYAFNEISKTKAKSIILSLPLHNERYKKKKDNHVYKYNKIIKNFAKKYKSILISCESLKPTFIDDNIHFDFDTQYKLAEKYIQSIIKMI